MPYARPAQQELPWQAGSDTSHDAAVAADGFANHQRARYFQWLRDRGEWGGTDKEAHAALGIERSSLCCRRMELRRQGRVEKTEMRREGCAVFRVRH